MNKQPANNDGEMSGTTPETAVSQPDPVIHQQASDTQTERIQQAILHDSMVAHWAIDPDNEQLTYATTGYETLLGGSMPINNDATTSLFELYHPDGREKLRGAIDLALEGRSVQFHSRVGPETEYSVWVSTSLRPVYEDEEIIAIAGISRDITGLKGREMDLRNSKQRYQTMINESSDIVLLVDESGIVTYSSPAIESQLGYDRQEILGNDFARLFDVMEKDRVHRLLEYIQNKEKSTITFEVQGTTADGNSTWLEIQGTDQTDESAISGVMLNIRDISDRKETEEQVYETQEKFEEILRSSPDMVAILDGDCQFNFVSASVQDTFGYSPQELVDENGYQYVHSDDREKVRKAVTRLVEKGEQEVREEYRVYDEEGDVHWLEARAQNRLDDPRINGVLVFAREITRRKEREQKLRIFKEAIENADHSISWTDPDGVIEYVNPAFEQTTGYTAEEAVGQTHTILKSGQHDVELYEEMWNTITEGGTWTNELINETKQGEEYRVNQTIKPIADETGEIQHYVAINDDITEQKQHEKELLRQKSLLESIMEAGIEGVLVHDEDGEIIHMNTPFLQMWDIDLPEAEVADDGELLNLVEEKVESPSDLTEIVDREYDSPELVTENVIETKDGRYFKRFSTPIKYEDGTYNGRVVAYRDITDIKERERQYRTLVENLPGMVYRSELDDSWPLERVHGEYESLTGYTADELLRGVIWGEEVIHPDDAAPVSEEVFEQLEEDNRFEVTYRIQTKEGDVKWVRERGQQVNETQIEGFITDITDQREREQELHRRTDIFEKAENIANLGAWEYDLETDELWWSDGIKQIHSVPSDFNPTVEKAFSFYRPEDQERLKKRYTEALEEEKEYDLEVKITDDSGTDRWIRTRGEPQYENGELVRLRGAAQEITEQYQYEKTLEGLNEAMQQLYRTETDLQIAHTAIDIIEDVLNVDTAAVYLYNEHQNTLQAAAASEMFDEVLDHSRPHFNPGETAVWEAYATGETQVVDGHSTSVGALRTADTVGVEVIAPLGEYGVIVLGDTDSLDLGKMQTDLVEVLASTTLEALERAEQTNELHKQHKQLEMKHERLERVETLNEEIRSIMDALVQAETGESINQSVCEAITRIDEFDYAWIGKPNADADKLEVAAQAGQSDIAELLPRELTEDNTLPAVHVKRSGEVQTADGVTSHGQDDEWRTALVREGYRAVVSIPLRYEDVIYGVLSVYSTDMDGFGSATETVLEDVGKLAGYAHNAVDQRGALLNGSSTTLTFDVRDYDAVFNDVAEKTGEKVIGEHIARAGDGSYLVYVTVSGTADVEEVKETFTSDPCVQSVECISEADRNLYEVNTVEQCVGAEVATLGSQFKSCIVEEGLAQVSVVVPSGQNTRAFINRVRNSIDNEVTLRSKEPGDAASSAYQVVLREHLSPMQEQVLQTAYHNGYFDKTRKRTGTAIAESLDIAQPTFSMRLRTAQRNLLQAMYEPRSE